MEVEENQEQNIIRLDTVNKVKENVGGMGQGKIKIFPNVSTQYIRHTIKRNDWLFGNFRGESSNGRYWIERGVMKYDR